MGPSAHIKLLPYFPSGALVAQPVEKTAAVPKIVDQRSTGRDFRLHTANPAHFAETDLETYGPARRVIKVTQTSVGRLIDLYV